jgi:tetratricopeptide (TPR) repeat protein
LARSRGDYDEAGRQYQRALDMDKRLGNQIGIADGHHGLGNIAYLRGDYDEAARQYQHALDTYERLGDQAGTANIYNDLGNIAYLRGDYDEAARQYQHALDTYERLGYQTGTAQQLQQSRHARPGQARGDYDEATRQYQRALDTFERLGDQVKMALAHHNLGMLAHGRGDYDEAARQYQHALDTYERLGDQARHGQQLQPAWHPGKGARRLHYRCPYVARASARDQAPPWHPPVRDRSAPPLRIPPGTRRRGVYPPADPGCRRHRSG